MTARFGMPERNLHPCEWPGQRLGVSSDPNYCLGGYARLSDQTLSFSREGTPSAVRFWRKATSDSGLVRSNPHLHRDSFGRTEREGSRSCCVGRGRSSLANKFSELIDGRFDDLATGRGKAKDDAFDTGLLQAVHGIAVRSRAKDRYRNRVRVSASLSGSLP